MGSGMCLLYYFIFFCFFSQYLDYQYVCFKLSFLITDKKVVKNEGNDLGYLTSACISFLRGPAGHLLALGKYTQVMLDMMRIIE